MTPQFLREGAARFRGMADTVEREASKHRLLMMAADYESRAMSADKLIEPSPSEPIPVKSGERTAKAPSEAIQGQQDDQGTNSDRYPDRSR